MKWIKKWIRRRQVPGPEYYEEYGYPDEPSPSGGVVLQRTPEEWARELGPTPTTPGADWRDFDEEAVANFIRNERPQEGEIRVIKYSADGLGQELLRLKPDDEVGERSRDQARLLIDIGKEFLAQGVLSDAAAEQTAKEYVAGLVVQPLPPEKMLKFHNKHLLQHRRDIKLHHEFLEVVNEIIFDRCGIDDCGCVITIADKAEQLADEIHELGVDAADLAARVAKLEAAKKPKRSTTRKSPAKKTATKKPTRKKTTA
jgi:hypothetical protein